MGQKPWLRSRGSEAVGQKPWVTSRGSEAVGQKPWIRSRGLEAVGMLLLSEAKVQSIKSLDQSVNESLHKTGLRCSIELNNAYMKSIPIHRFGRTR